VNRNGSRWAFTLYAKSSGIVLTIPLSEEGCYVRQKVSSSEEALVHRFLKLKPRGFELVSLKNEKICSL
jgi:hypothetical protein